MLPQDPMILLSVLNTKLRDEYGSLSELCKDLELDEQELKNRMEAVGFVYCEDRNRFQ